MRTTKKMQGEWIVDKGNYHIKQAAYEIFIRIHKEDEEGSENYDVCRMGADETGNPLEAAELICKAVNERQKLLDSNRELIIAANQLVVSLTDLEMADKFKASINRIQTAINNAKNNLP